MIEVADFKGDVWEGSYVHPYTTNKYGLVEVSFRALFFPSDSTGSRVREITVPVFTDWWPFLA